MTIQTIAPMTELEAVNEMLESVGQSPVSSLSAPIRDVNVAKKGLLKISRRVQLIGWHWNTDNAYVLTPDIDGFITLPEGVLRLDTTNRNEDLTARRRPGTEGPLSLYSRSAQSFTFTGPVAVKVIWGFTFEDLPEAARSYIAISAARKFQARFIGSTQLDGFNAEDEQSAWQQLVRDERATRNTNLFRANPRLNRSVNNRSGPYRRSYP